MDIVLNLCDEYFFTPYIYNNEKWPEDSFLRQFISLSVIAAFGGYILYFVTAGLNYMFIFDKTLMKHPLFLKDQIKREIKVSCFSIPCMSGLSVLCFIFEVRGYSKLYDSVSDSSYGWYAVAFSFISLALFTDCLIYWIHRTSHMPWAYKYLHKVHHLWKIPTPFASHAFHPIDGFLQGCPYHIYVFAFPMHKTTFLAMFVLANIWSVSLHDGDVRVPKLLRPFICGSAHHTDHHLFYNYNYGQFFTLWDKIGGSLRLPSSYEGDSPLEQIMRKGLTKCIPLKNGNLKTKRG